MVGDYAFVRNSHDEIILKLLVIRLYPSGLWFVCVVNRKGTFLSKPNLAYTMALQHEFSNNKSPKQLSYVQYVGSLDKY